MIKKDVEKLVFELLRMSEDAWLKSRHVSDCLEELHHLDEYHARRAAKLLLEGCSVARATGLGNLRRARVECPEGVLSPRADSEVMIEAALRWTAGREKGWVADLGCGSGALLAAFLLERKQWKGVGVDRSKEAVEATKRTLLRNGLSAEVTLGDWMGEKSVECDLVLWNPPYVKTDEANQKSQWDPLGALDGGHDGLDCYRNAPWHWVKPGHWMVVEMGDGQRGDVERLLSERGTVLECAKDIQGIDRVLIVSRKD